MRHEDFRIGMEFTMSDSRWRCTDIGSRTITAIKYLPQYAGDPTWYRGPTYAVPEHVIDEDDMPACEAVPTQRALSMTPYQVYRHTSLFVTTRYLELETRGDMLVESVWEVWQWMAAHADEHPQLEEWATKLREAVGVYRDEHDARGQVPDMARDC